MAHCATLGFPGLVDALHLATEDVTVPTSDRNSGPTRERANPKAKETVPDDIVHPHLTKSDADNLYVLTKIWIDVLIRSATEQESAAGMLAILDMLSSGVRFAEELERIASASTDTSE